MRCSESVLLYIFHLFLQSGFAFLIPFLHLCLGSCTDTSNHEVIKFVRVERTINITWSALPGREVDWRTSCKVLAPGCYSLASSKLQAEQHLALTVHFRIDRIQACCVHKRKHKGRADQLIVQWQILSPESINTRKTAQSEQGVCCVCLYVYNNYYLQRDYSFEREQGEVGR